MWFVGFPPIFMGPSLIYSWCIQSWGSIPSILSRNAFHLSLNPLADSPVASGLCHLFLYSQNALLELYNTQSKDHEWKQMQIVKTLNLCFNTFDTEILIFHLHISFKSKIAVDSDCSHEIKRHLLLGRKTMTNLDSILTSRDIILLTKVHVVKAMVLPLVMYGCENCTIKKAECQRIDAF